jgi:hypothetical protein
MQNEDPIQLGGFMFADPAEPQPAAPPAPPEPPVAAGDQGAPPEPPASPEPPAAPTTPPEAEPVPGKLWYNLAKSFQTTDKVLPEDVEIPEDIDGEGLKSLLLEELTKQAIAKASESDLVAAERKKLEAKGLTAEQIESAMAFSQARAEGIEPEELQHIQYYDAMSAYVPQEYDHKLEYVRRRYLAAGQEPALVESYLKKEYGDQEDDDAMARLDQEVEAATGIFGKLKAAISTQVKQRVETEKAERDRQIQEERKAIDKVLETGLYGVKLAKADREKLLKDIYEVDSYETVDTDAGPQRIALTKEAKAYREIMASPEKRAMMSFIAINGVEAFVSLVSKKTSDSFLRAIQSSEMPAPPKDGDVPPVITRPEDRFAPGENAMTIPVKFNA